MSFEGVNIAKLNGGLGNRNPSTDGVMMLLYVVKLADLPGVTQHYKAIEMKQPKDAEDAGFDVALDANKKILAYHAVREFFRNAPNGTLHFVPVPNALDPQEIMEKAEVKTVIRSLPEAKGIAIGGTDEDIDDLIDLVNPIQAVINQFATEHRLIDFVLLQGNGHLEADEQIALSEYPDFRAKNAPNVCVSIAQDPAIAKLESEYELYADVGAVLGMVAVRQVNENIGSVNILNPPRNRKGEANYTLSGVSEWLGSNLSDGRSFDTLSITDENGLTAKGYIFAGSYKGYPGVYLNGSPTAIEMASDYAYIENNRVWNKAARAIRLALIPEVKGVVKKDPQTGYIRATTISAWESKANKALEQMLIDDEISGYETYIDPKQLVNETSPLQVNATVVMDGIVHEFDVDLGLANSLE
ncbi:MAG: DUF2586 domain-containing protein [Chitinophagales bacterium]|nr:DUF2586 domain-containing protein [Chitinophagales bacterium]